jgi:bifunctional UDP-N-acetylglucosamine pyrophosphorylase/glucosamine-1-phosphate N-acetyltransferase
MKSNNSGHRAIVFLPHSPQQDGAAPLFLEDILFRPAAAWTIQALFDAGVEQFFLVCGEALRDSARACFPDGAQLTIVDEENPAEQLSAFLREATGAVFVVTRPVYLSSAGAKLLSGSDPLPKNGVPGGIFRLTAKDLAEALDGGEDFKLAIEHLGQQLYRPFRHEALPRMIPLNGWDDLQEAQAAGRREVVARHLAAGVKILDPAAVYLDPRGEIGAGTLLLPGTILRGHTVVGKDCEIGPNTMITDCSVGDHCTVNASQCYESRIGASASWGRLPISVQAATFPTTSSWATLWRSRIPTSAKA